MDWNGVYCGTIGFNAKYSEKLIFGITSTLKYFNSIIEALKHICNKDYQNINKFVKWL